jgi:hypothetical protein
MEKIQEFAEQYTLAERVRLVVFGCVSGAVVIGSGKLWLFPWLHAFSASAHCSNLLGFNGTTVLWHGLFVGIPLFSAILVGALVGRRGFKILQQGRTPPAGEKVFRPTPIVRGRRAKLRGLVQFFAALPLVAIAAWGYVQAEQLAAKPLPSQARCTITT